MRIAAASFAVLFVGFNLYQQIWGGWQQYKRTYIAPKRPELYGLYDVESGPDNWAKVFVAFPGNLGVRMKDDRVRYLQAQYNGDSVILNQHDQLKWRRPDPDHVALTGAIDGVPATLMLRKIDTSKFLIFSRGFHWINETPFNR